MSEIMRQMRNVQKQQIQEVKTALRINSAQEMVNMYLVLIWKNIKSGKFGNL